MASSIRRNRVAIVSTAQTAWREAWLEAQQARRVRAAMRAPPLSGLGVHGTSGDGASLAGPHCSLHCAYGT